MKYVILPLFIIFIYSCASPKYGSQKAVIKQIEEETKISKQAIDNTIENMPDWMTKPPQDVNSIYTTGTYLSKDMQRSIDGASRNALNELALTISGNLNSLVNEYVEETGFASDSTIINEVSRVTSMEAINTKIIGHKRVDSKLMRNNQSYRAFVLIQYPIGEFNKLALQVIKNNKLLESKLKSSDAFKRLEEKANN